MIKQTDMTNLESSTSHAMAFENYQQLVAAYTATRDLLGSDGDVIVNGTLVHTYGALLRSREVIKGLQDPEDERQEKEVARVERIAKTERKTAEKDEKSRQKAADKALASAAKVAPMGQKNCRRIVLYMRVPPGTGGSKGPKYAINKWWNCCPAGQ